MSLVVCPIECVKSACDEPDFLTKHGAWLLTVITAFSAAISLCLTYFLKSRCKNIKTPCISCERDVITLDPAQVEIRPPT